MLEKIDHIAITVRDIEKAVKSYADMFGFKVAEKRDGPGGEFISMMMTAGDIRIELLQPLKPGSFMRFLEKHGGLHHVSFTTSDIEKDLKKLKAQGRKLIDEEPMSMPSGERIACVHPGAAENVMIELVERG